MEKTVYSKSKAPPPISHREDTPTEEQGTHRTREKSRKSRKKNGKNIRQEYVESAT